MADGEMELRVSTAEREAVANLLGSAMADGRLTMPEYEDRLGAVWASKTRGDLAVITDDLPHPVPSDPEPTKAVEKRSKDWMEYWDEWRWWLGGVVIMTGIWGIQSVSDGELRNFWPAWPIGIWAVVLVAMVFFPDDRDDEE